MLELYHSGLTTCSKQVRHCLREKGLPTRAAMSSCGATRI